MSAEKKAGAKQTCGSCGNDLICKMSEYTNQENKLQWQNESGGAHFKWIGPQKYKCVDSNGVDIPLKETKVPDTPDPPKEQTLTDKPKEQTELKVGSGMAGPVLQPLDEGTSNLIHNDAILLFKVREVVIDAIAQFDKNPNQGMIWQMTELIWKKHFGERKHE